MLKKNWDEIKSVFALKVKAKTSPNSLTLNGVTITNKKSIVETINNFFVNVGSNLALKNPNGKIHLKIFKTKSNKLIFSESRSRK